MTHIDCIARDGEIVPVSMDFIKNCATLSNLLDEIELAASGIPIPGLSKQEITDVYTQFQLQDIIGDADVILDDVSIDFLLRMMESANYLACDVVLQDAAHQIAVRLEGKSRDEMRDMLHIVNDFSPEEESAVVAETSWAYM